MPDEIQRRPIMYLAMFALTGLMAFTAWSSHQSTVDNRGQDEKLTAILRDLQRLEFTSYPTDQALQARDDVTNSLRLLEARTVRIENRLDQLFGPTPAR